MPCSWRPLTRPANDVVVFGEAENATSFASLLEHGDEPPEVRIDPEDTAVIPYSSGTTGLPKGVGSATAPWPPTCSRRGSSSPTGKPHSGGGRPFFHAVGFRMLLNCGLAAGATIVSLPRFDLETFLAAIQDHRATGTVVVPPIALALARHPAVDNYDLSSLRFLGCGAAPLGVECSRKQRTAWAASWPRATG